MEIFHVDRVGRGAPWGLRGVGMGGDGLGSGVAVGGRGDIGCC